MLDAFGLNILQMISTETVESTTMSTQHYAGRENVKRDTLILKILETIFAETVESSNIVNQIVCSSGTIPEGKMSSEAY